MKKIVILGAGISGLALAWFFKKRYEDVQITILEKNSRAGGWIETINKEGFLFELGPRGFRPKGAGIETLHLIEGLGLQEQVIAADPAAHIRYLYRHQTLQKIPNGLRAALMSPLTRSLPFLFCRELFRSKCGKIDPSMYDFIAHRFNQHVAEEFMDPLNSGIYAGDIRKLSMKSCFPAVYDLEQEYGSIIKGMLFKKKKKKDPESSFIQKMTKESVVSFKNGMQTLTDTLQEHLQEHTRFNCEVLGVEPGFTIQTSAGAFEADYLFSTLPARQVSHLFKLPSVEAVSVAVVNLGFREVLNIPKGFGYLIPSNEKEKVLGMVWDSHVFPQQNQGAETRVTVMIGGAHMLDFQSYEGKDFLQLALEALSKHLGLNSIPDCVHVKIAQEAIPQYHVGHAAKLQELKALLPEKMVLLGSSYHGVSVNDCIAQASVHAFLPDCKKRSGQPESV